MIRFGLALMTAVVCLVTGTGQPASAAGPSVPDPIGSGLSDAGTLVAGIGGTLSDVGGVLSRALQPGSAAATRALDGPDTTDPTTLGAHVFQGTAFDACTAPDLATMTAWRGSRYGAVGVYVGGRARSCTQPRLTRSWVRSVTDMGWRILPLYVGSQSPCASSAHARLFPIDGTRAAAQGTSEAADAVKAAAALGIVRDSPVYLDMESYDTRYARCTAPVLAFAQAWDRNLRAKGYLPGFYSSADTGVTRMEAARAAGAADLPEVMWFARWRVPATIYGEPDLASTAWRPHRRIHQYVGESRETFGGHTLVVDRNLVDAPVAIVA